jgi:hypothetical protein
MNRALYDPEQSAPELAEFAFLRLYAVDKGEARELGEAQEIIDVPDFAFNELAWTHEVQVYRDLCLVGIPLLASGSASDPPTVVGYALYRFDEQGVEPAVTLDLLAEAAGGIANAATGVDAADEEANEEAEADELDATDEASAKSEGYSSVIPLPTL